MALTLTFQHTPSEKKKYVFDYTRWLDPTELISTFDYSVSDPAIVAGEGAIESGSTVVHFFVSGGVANTVYNVSLIVETTLGQIKEDTIKIIVEDPLAPEHLTSR